MANPINDKYQELRQTEKEIFDQYPLLKVAKPVAQTLLIPAAVATGAAHLPLAGPLIGGAISQGTDFLQNNMHGLREAQIVKHFAEARENIQPGFMYWARQKAFDDWATMRSADLLGKSDMLTRPIAGYLAPTAIGKAMMDTAPAVAKYVTQLPISKAIGQTIDKTQALFSNVQDWLTASLANVREYGLHAEKFVQKEVNKLSDNQNPEQRQNQGKEHTQKQGAFQSDAPIAPDDLKEIRQEIAQSETKLEPGNQRNDSQENIAPTEVIAPDLKPETPEPVLRDTSDDLGEGIPEFLTQSKQEPDLVASDYFQGLASELSGKGIQADNMRMWMNGEEVFRLKDGQPDPNHTSISNEQMAQFKAALADPKNFQGTIELRQGNRLLLSIKDGKVFDPTNKVSDALNLKMDTSPQTTTEGFYQKAAEGVKDPESVQGMTQIASNAIEMGHSQSEIKTMLMEHNPTIKEMVKKHGPEHANSVAQSTIQTAADNRLMNKPEVKQELKQQQEQQQKQKQGQKI